MMKTLISAVVFTATAFAVPLQADDAQLKSDILAGKFRVVDGDTLNVNGVYVRLADIDAPEINQPYGKQAKAALINMIDTVLDGQDNMYSRNLPFGIWCEAKRDKYHRKICNIGVEKVTVGAGENTWAQRYPDINKSMVKYGYAWAYGTKYRRLEKKAQRDNSGLWVGNDPVRPSAWRKGKS